MPFKVLVTDYVWPSIEPGKKAVLERIGAELVVAPDSRRGHPCRSGGVTSTAF